MDNTQIVQELEDIKGSLGEIHQCLLGSEFTRGRGLVDDVMDLKRRMYVVELFVKKTKWLIGLAAGAGGVVGFAIQMLTQYFLTKK
jgi:hypothetical protein